MKMIGMMQLDADAMHNARSNAWISWGVYEV